MAQTSITTNSHNFNPLPVPGGITYGTERAARQRKEMTYREDAKSVTLPNPGFNQDVTVKLAALRETDEGCYQNAGHLLRLIKANPEATVAELSAMLRK